VVALRNMSALCVAVGTLITIVLVGTKVLWQAFFHTNFVLHIFHNVDMPESETGACGFDKVLMCLVSKTK